MKSLTRNVIILFSTFFVGATAYYLSSFSSNEIKQQFQPINTLTPTPEIVLKNPEEKSVETDFLQISPCTTKDSFKKYSMRSKGTISGGVVNHRVECGNLPERDQSNNDFSGKITVQVLIDTFGEVEDAQIEEGNSPLNNSVLHAARKTRFSPMMLGGDPVKVRGVLVYKFESNGTVGLQKYKMPY